MFFMNVTVLKFGGGCVSYFERITQTLKVIKFHYDRGDHLAVAVSALGVSPDPLSKLTDFLLYVSSLVKKRDYRTALGLVREAKAMYIDRGSNFGIERQVFDAVFEDLEAICSRKGFQSFEDGFRSPDADRTRELLGIALDDKVAGFGELGSIELIAGGLRYIGIPAEAVDSAKSGFVSNSNFKNARLTKQSLNQLIGQEFMKKRNRNPDAVLVYSGFNACDVYGNRTTLGRDGTTVTALAMGAATNANAVIIYSDDAILPIDPKIVKKAVELDPELGKRMAERPMVPVRYLSYGEFMTMAGWKVKAIPASMIDVLQMHQRLPPIYMRNVNNPEDEGTLITPHATDSGHVKSMAVRDNISYREFPIEDDKQAARLREMVYSYDGVSVIRCVDRQDVKGRIITFTYQVDPKFISRLKEEPELMQRMFDKLGSVDPKFISDPERYFKGAMLAYLRQAIGNGALKSVQLYDASLLTLIGHDLGTSYTAISEVMEILGRAQIHQKLQELIHRLPIERERHYIQIIIPRGLESVVSEIHNALYVGQSDVANGYSPLAASAPLQSVLFPAQGLDSG